MQTPPEPPPTAPPAGAAAGRAEAIPETASPQGTADDLTASSEPSPEEAVIPAAPPPPDLTASQESAAIPLTASQEPPRPSSKLERRPQRSLLGRLGAFLSPSEPPRIAELDAFGRDAESEARLVERLSFLYRRWFRVEATGLEHVPSTGPAILVANHAGVLPWDMAMLKCAIALDHPAHRTLRPLVEDALMFAPFVGTVLARGGAVRANPENAEAVLRDGELVSAFPEGNRGIAKPYAQRYKLQRFGRGGAIRLALRTGAPVIPVAIVGSEEVHPLLLNLHRPARSLGMPVLPVTPTFPLFGAAGTIPLPVKWRIEFGAPLRLEAPADADDRTILRLNEQLRTDIQERLDRLVAARRGIFR